jgi:hypothetical protein
VLGAYFGIEFREFGEVGKYYYNKENIEVETFCMSHNESSGSFGAIRLILFLAILIISAPFLVIGNYKNSNIKAGLDKGKHYLGQGQYKKAEEALTKAEEHFGILYTGYTMALEVVGSGIGGKYYKHDQIIGIKGFAQVFGIAERMAEGDIDVRDQLMHAEHNLSKLDCRDEGTTMLHTVGTSIHKSLGLLLPIVKLCKESKRMLGFGFLLYPLRNSCWLKNTA